ncbi:MAG: hypothetical protein KGO52_05195 [Nitrospirota bacterium]|nr:hypothetical protein [Nitrospirota bacterium]
MPRSAQRFLVLPILCILAVPFPALAETKVLTAEGTYTMGEGETMAFAESMALQKAKQMALEQAGTYVESYTKVQNYQLTADEIQTIAGGVLQVEVLDKTRTLVGDSLKFFVKIKATVTTDKVSELAQRIKGKNVAEEYKKLQEDYARLSKEIETYKQIIAKTPTGPEREAVLDQIREREKAFEVVRKSEEVFLQRLFSGQTLVREALDERATVDRLLQTIKDQGHVAELGKPTAHISSNSDFYIVTVPITLRISDSLPMTIASITESLGGVFSSVVFRTRIDSKPSLRYLIPNDTLAMLNFASGRRYDNYYYKGDTNVGEPRGIYYDQAPAGSLIRLSIAQQTDQYFFERLGELLLIISLLLEDNQPLNCKTPFIVNRIFPVKNGIWLWALLA